LEATHFVVIFCGRINQMKRPLLAVKAFAQFALQYPNARLLVIGDGAAMTLLKAEVSAQCLTEKVIFTGQVPDTSPYYAASDCYLSTSKNEEGYSLATAEALASGLTAVVPNDDVFNAVYGQCLAVSRCSPADSAAYAAALLSFALCDDVQRQDHSQNAMEFANTHLSTELMDHKLTEFYKKNLY
jgi:glycosyltransferase involved in cell wall biosynthesis